MTELGKETLYVHVPINCNLGQADQYRSDEEKDKVYVSRSKLREHEVIFTHTKKGEVLQKLDYLKKHSEDGHFHCPYFGCDWVTSTRQRLVNHIEESNGAEDEMSEDEKRKAVIHDAQKRKDGWYDDDFNPSIAERDPRRIAALRRRVCGVTYSKDKEVQDPLVVASESMIILGGTNAGTIEHFKVMYGDLVESEHTHHAGNTGEELNMVHSNTQTDIVDQETGELRSDLKYEVEFGNEDERLKHPLHPSGH